MDTSKLVILTCDHRMGRNQDEGILRHNEDWAEQVVSHRRRAGADGGVEYIHEHAEPDGRGDAAIRRGMVRAFRAAATAAGEAGTIFLMVGHGSEQMVDLAPAPLLRVTEDTIRAAYNLEANRRARSDTSDLSYENEVQTLLALRDAIKERFKRLDLATCNVGRGRGPDLCGRLQRFFEIESVRGLDGFLWSARVPSHRLADSSASRDGRTVVGVGQTNQRGDEPERIYGYRLPPLTWMPHRRIHGPPSLRP